MKKRINFPLPLVLGTLILLSVAVSCWAESPATAGKQPAAAKNALQSRKAPPPSPPGKEVIVPGVEVQIFQERLQMIRMWKLTQLLSLDPVKASMLFPVLNKYDQQRLVLMRQQQMSFLKLSNALKTKPQPPAGKIVVICNELEKIQSSMDKIRSQENTEVKRILAPQEYANFLIFSENFPREMKRIIQEKRTASPGTVSPGMASPAPPSPRTVSPVPAVTPVRRTTTDSR